MRDYLPKYLNAFLLAFATFAVVFAIFIAKDPNISHHLYFSTSYSSQWTSSFSSAFITVSMSIFIPFHPHLDCNKCLKLQFNCLCYVSIYIQRDVAYNSNMLLCIWKNKWKRNFFPPGLVLDID